MKGLHVYLAFEDYCAIFDMLDSYSCAIYAKKKESFIRLETRPIRGIDTFYAFLPANAVPDFQSEYIYVVGPSQTERGMLSAGFVGGTCTTKESKAIFNRIIRFVKTTYQRTYDKAFYLGPVFYQRWLMHEVKLDCFADAESFLIMEEQLPPPDLLNRLKEMDLMVATNGRDIRLEDLASTVASESMIAYRQGAELSFWLSSRKKYFYPDSDCIFIWREKHRKNTFWRVLIDSRVLWENRSAAESYQKLRTALADSITSEYSSITENR